MVCRPSTIHVHTFRLLSLFTSLFVGQTISNVQRAQLKPLSLTINHVRLTCELRSQLAYESMSMDHMVSHEVVYFFPERLK